MDHSTAIKLYPAFHLLAINPQSTVFLAVLLLVLLLLSFIISGAGVAIFSLLPKDVNMLKTKQHAAARRITTLLNERRAVYTSLLIAGTIFDIGIIILGNFLLTPVLQLGSVHIFIPINLDLLVKTLIMAFVIVLFGKILPKVWATQNNLRFAYSTSAVVEGIHLLMRRISLRMVDIAENISQVSGASQQQTKSLRELDEAIDVNTTETSDGEKNILKGIVKFGNISVKQIMRFRLDVSGLEYDMPFREVLAKVEDLHYSRLPVYRKSLDNIAGVLNTKDLLPFMHDAGFDWHTLIRPTFFVPESKLIKDLLKEFQSKRIHFAIVVDEFGGTSGIVTMEDILEEIIGDIRDEFDEEESGIQKVAENSYIIDGKMMLYDMCRHLNIALDTFDQIKGESDSVAGLVLELAGAIPQTNETLTVGDFQFKVLNVEKTRIGSVQVTIARREENKTGHTQHFTFPIYAIMTLEHVAIWTNRLEALKDYYVQFFGGQSGVKYCNKAKGFESYFLTFASGARLELMSRTGIPDNANDTVNQQHLGIIHLAFGADSPEAVDAKARELKASGFAILSGPRKTGDGYYEFETLDPDNNRLEVTTVFR